MKIAQIAPVEESVPPFRYGGTELVVSNLTEELVKRGHDVTLFASGDSKTKAKLIPLVPKAVRPITDKLNNDEKKREYWKTLALIKLSKYLANEKFDIIHSHYGWKLCIIQPFLDSLLVETHHCSFEHPDVQLIHSLLKSKNCVSISLAQRRHVPFIKFIGNVYNGINLKNYTYNKNGGDYFAFLGRTSPSKGIKEAIMIAKKANIQLKIAAKIDLDDLQYYKKEIEPLIDGKQIEYIGEIDLKQKNQFLGNAKALLAPIQWDEPFGLYFIEAMATGTPVIVFNRGSVKEVIKNGETGFICQPNDMNYIIKMVKLTQSLPINQYQKMRRNCRAHVEKNFTVEKMVDGYEEIYKKIYLEKIK